MIIEIVTAGLWLNCAASINGDGNTGQNVLFHLVVASLFSVIAYLIT